MLGLGTDTGDTTPSVLLFFDQERCAAARLSTAHGHSRSPASQSLWLQRTAAPQLPVQGLASSKRLRLQRTACPQVPVQRLASSKRLGLQRTAPARRYLFNAGEGFQRYANEYGIKLNKLSGVLLTRMSTDAAGGLPGRL